MRRRNGGIGVRPNLDEEFIQAVTDATELTFTPDGPGDLASIFGPEDVFHYIYAILHSPTYRTRYADFLKSDFPRIPLTRNLDLFRQFIMLGQRLTELHLMEAEPQSQPRFPLEGNLRVDRLRHAETPDGHSGQVYINNNQFFDGVTKATWEFTIGGYRPAEKWLKDRKGRTLTADDVRHYRKMCGALAETQELMTEIDEAIDDAGVVAADLDFRFRWNAGLRGRLLVADVEGAGHVHVGVALGYDLPLVVELAASRKTKLHLGAVAGDVEPQGNQGVAA